MPKRETSKKRGWFSWGRSPEYENASTSEKLDENQADLATPTSSPQSSVPNSPSKVPPATETMDLQQEQVSNRSLLIHRLLIERKATF